jgi:eukaryotic-like serine/threonine-protein kinase
MSNPSPAKHLSSGSALGRYELLLPIAKGGMAEVWAARLHGTRGFQKVVAIKTILSGAIDDARMEEMFLVEAELASQIHHPNVVGTIDLGEHEGILYLVMEWVDGESLNVLMQKAAPHGGVPLAIGVNLIGQACQGLYAAHHLRDDQGSLLGVVHRDVSPHNVLVTYSGTAKLVDFGIAKATSQASSTEAGEVKGKFAYMAPEQIRAQPVDARTDLFALGILLYQITTGKHPFRGENPAETLQNICAERGPIPPSAFLPDYPAELEAVVLKALAKNADRRFASANDMLTALEKAMPGPLEASFELQVAEYLKQLFGPRVTERRAALRVAQERIDQQRAESSSQISLGTLRAIAIDRMDGTGSSQTPGLVSSPLLNRNTPTPTPTPTPVPRGRSKQVIAALAGALAIAGGALMLKLPSSSSGSQPTGAAGMVPVETIMPQSAKVAPPPSAPLLQAAAPSATAPAEEPERNADNTKKALRERKAPMRGGRPVAVSGLPSAPAVAAGTPPTMATPSATTTTTAAGTVSGSSTNTLGRGAFGGRH